MVYESWPWKKELTALSRRARRALAIGRTLNRMPDVAKGTMVFERAIEAQSFALEKTILYTAIIIRSLMDSGKVSDEMANSCMDIRSHVPLQSIGFLEKHLSPREIDLSSGNDEKLLVRYALNQIIHSYVVMSFLMGDDGSIDGFLVTSDTYRNKRIFEIRMSDWLDMVRSVIDDLIVSHGFEYDPETGEQTFVRSSLVGEASLAPVDDA